MTSTRLKWYKRTGASLELYGPDSKSQRIFNMKQPYPVTAYALCNALGMTTTEVIGAFSEGRSGLGRPNVPLDFETFCGSMVTDLPALPASIAAYDTRLARMSVVAFDGISQAVARAVARWGGERVALVFGTSTGGVGQSEAADVSRRVEGQLPAFYNFQRHHPFHVVADALALLAGIKGPRYVISTACSSGGKALASAQRLLDQRVVDAVLTGSVDALCQTTLRGFHSLSIVSTEPCRPFCEHRDGISLGEGAALLLVERQGEGPGRLLAVGETSDAYHMSSPDPEGRGAGEAMGLALEQGGLMPDELDLIYAHGTGTKHNDAAEARAIAALCGEKVPVVSTKAYTGHLLAASGSTGAVFSLATIERQWVPASLGADPVAEDLGINVNLRAEERRVHSVLSNSFGFGGTNVSVLIGGPQ
jgi:3-oxoacyl-[acyl-carrier-protein] synthase-1